MSGRAAGNLKDVNTEEHIVAQAKQLFFAVGKLSASTQEIADFAGVKRTLINYYFGSKQKLFDRAFDEMRYSFNASLSEVLGSIASVYDKVAGLIDTFTTFMEQYPYFNIFLITELNTTKKRKKEIIQRYQRPELENFYMEIQQEMDAGNIPKMDPFNYYVNIFSLVSYPIIMRPYYDRIFNMTKKEMDSMYQKRKQDILRLLFINQ